MKICWDNLEKLEYIGNNIWHRIETCNYFVYKEHCKSCDKPYLTDKYKQSKFCTKYCACQDEEFKQTLRVKGIKRFEDVSVRLQNKLTQIRVHNTPEMKNKSKDIMTALWKNTSSIFHTKRYRENLHTAQTKAQNRSEVIEKKSASMKKAWLNQKNKLHSVEYRNKLSDLLKNKDHPIHKTDKTGSNNWNWKGGITPERTKIWHSPEYKLWRQSVFVRDNFTCQLCGYDKGRTLNAHHIKKFSDYPEFRFDINNGITLCQECHEKTYGKEEQFENLFILKVR